ncbi:hypothetical protein Hdeb2414_s0557g00916311 [Helianthus debilis subsp. tardiflorus]
MRGLWFSGEIHSRRTAAGDGNTLTKLRCQWLQSSSSRSTTTMVTNRHHPPPSTTTVAGGPGGQGETSPSSASLFTKIRSGGCGVWY